MRKIWKVILGVMVVFSLAACSPTTDKSATMESNSVTETTAKEKVEKLPDADAIDMKLASIYYPNGTGLKQAVDGVEELDAKTLVSMLITYGVLDEGTEVLEFETEGKREEQISGPGEAKVVSLFDSAVLDLSQIPEGIDDLLLETAIVNTFTESMNIQELTIKVDGVELVTGAAYNESYRKLQGE